MHVLVVTQYFWPEQFKINDLVAGLKNRGYQVTILTGKPNYPSGRLFKGYRTWGIDTHWYEGCKVIRVPLIVRGRGGSLRLAANYLSFNGLASLLAPFLLKDKYDLIFVYGLSPILVGLPAIVMKLLIKKPLLYWVQDLWPESLAAAGAVKSTGLLKMAAIVVRYIYHKCDLILVQSKPFQASIEQHGVKSSRIVYFPNWAEAFYIPVAKTQLLEQKGVSLGFRVMFAGNLGVSQDFPAILDAAERLKNHSDIQWVILGNGRMKSWLDQQITARGLQHNVNLLGEYPAESMPHYFACADVLLVTLKSSPIFSLTIPSKLQTYLACGKAIISAVDGEGNRVLEEAGAGVCCPPGDSEALADSVLKLYGMTSEQRNQLGKQGRHYYEQKFERDMLLDKLENWMKQAT